MWLTNKRQHNDHKILRENETVIINEISIILRNFIMQKNRPHSNIILIKKTLTRKLLGNFQDVFIFEFVLQKSMET